MLWPAQVATGARDIPATNRAGPYVSKMWALNLNAGEPGGDWHGAIWFRRESMVWDPIKLYAGRTLDVVGDTGLYDARGALRDIGHPQGWQLGPVWAANHPRACIDLLAGAIERLAHYAREDGCATLPPSADDLSGWLMCRDGVREALSMARRMGAGDEEYADVWGQWATRRQEEVEAMWGKSL